MANSAAAANQKLTSERRNNVVKWNNLSLSSSHRSEEMTPTVAMEKEWVSTLVGEVKNEETLFVFCFSQMSANCGWCLDMLSRMKNAVLSNCVNSSSSPTSTKSAEGYWAVISTKESGTRSWNLRKLLMWIKDQISLILLKNIGRDTSIVNLQNCPAFWNFGSNCTHSCWGPWQANYEFLGPFLGIINCLFRDCYICVNCLYVNKRAMWLKGFNEGVLGKIATENYMWNEPGIEIKLYR